jgi:hypothetical protein
VSYAQFRSADDVPDALPLQFEDILDLGGKPFDVTQLQIAHVCDAEALFFQGAVAIG